MGVRNAIGIDPDSKGFVCAYVKFSETKVSTKGYMTTDSDLKSFLRWVKGEGDVIVAIEGSNGLSRPIEKALREAGIIFYSFKPADTDKFRKAVLGQNKDNKKDAESVARYAMALEAQGKLERYRRVWFPDQELQLLTRSFERKSQEMTAEVNRLWKLLRLASPDLYLALGQMEQSGGGAGREHTENPRNSDPFEREAEHQRMEDPLRWATPGGDGRRQLQGAA